MEILNTDGRLYSCPDAFILKIINNFSVLRKVIMITSDSP